MPRQFGKVDSSVRWPACPSCTRRHDPDGICPPSGSWLSDGGPARLSGVVWLVRPMPNGEWPPDQRAPRDDSFSWLVRSHCGHEGGGKLWAFYVKADAEQYEAVFRDNPCRWTNCKIKNNRRR